MVTKYSNQSSKLKIGIVVLLVILAIVAYFYIAPNKQKDSYSYITKALKRGDLTMLVSATGYIQPVEKVEVGSEVSGTIKKVFVDFNDIVKKGEVLAQLDKVKYTSSYNKAKASLNSAKATLKNMEALLYKASSTLNRDKKLKIYTKEALPSQSDWDLDYSNYLSAKAQLESAKAQIQSAKQSLISAKYDLDKTTIFSPIDGTVLERNIDEGQTVAASFQTPVLFKIAKDLTKMELQASIDEADIASVKDNQNAIFSVEAYTDKTFSGKIRMIRVNSEIVDGVVTYKAIMDVDNTKLLLKPGMSADVDIETQTIKNSFIVTKAALLYIPIVERSSQLFGAEKKDELVLDKKPHIWVLKENKPIKVYVKVIGNSGYISAIESNELSLNDKIITMQEKSK